MRKEIGSDFWVNPEKEKDFTDISALDIAAPFSKEYKYYYSSGRNAIRALIKNYSLAKSGVILPVYCCYAVLEPFYEAGCKVGFYQVNERFEIEIQDLQKKVMELKPQCILIMSYFGIRMNEKYFEVLRKLQKSGIRIIEDITQSLFTKCCYPEADYYVGSFRKWEAVTDGGILAAKKPMKTRERCGINQKLADLKKEAFIKKYEYMELNKGEKEIFYQMQLEAERLNDCDKTIYAMSDTGKRMLCNWNFERIVKKRRDNFQRLAQGLRENQRFKPAYTQLGKDEVPLYFMVYCKENRNGVQAKLAKRNIYTAVIWPMAREVEKAAGRQVQYIYKNSLAVPCDQRYGKEEMDRVIKALGEW